MSAGVRVEGEWVRNARGNLVKHYGPPRTPVAASDFPSPRVIGDGMEPTEHIDGRLYDSKSAFRAVTKANGMIEVGNDPARFNRPGQVKANPEKRREAVNKAMAKAGL